jgi:parallel beta-helix repeat protein
VLFQGNELAYNNPAWHYSYTGTGREFGGVKIVRSRYPMARGNYVHHNNGHGMWTDIHNIYALYENNRLVGNAGAGIFHEVSYAAVIRNNTVTGNALVRSGMYGAGILVSSSPDVEVYGNTVTGNQMGITAIQNRRGSGKYGPHLVQNLYVHDNTVQTAGQTGIQQTIGSNAVYTSWNNRFRHNTYTGMSKNRNPFYWMNNTRTVPQWKGYGHDLTGTFQP